MAQFSQQTHTHTLIFENNKPTGMMECAALLLFDEIFQYAIITTESAAIRNQKRIFFFLN